MIKVTDLMINDWVKLNDSNYQVQVIKKKGVIKLYENTKYGEHEIELNTDWIEEFIEPIPLTPEILEKNGYSYNETRDAWELIPNDGYGVCYEDNTYLFSLGVFDPFNQDSDITYHAITEINYAHEFQHALKLCGIEKEIVL